MKKYRLILAAAVLAAGIFPLHAQSGGGPGAPQFDSGMDKLFGDNQTFSAMLEVQMNNGVNPTTVSGKMSFDKGNSRFEMNMADMKGGNITPDTVAQMKSMGMDRMISISQKDKKAVYVIYPNAQAYVEVASADSDSGATNSDAKMETTELGKETVDGHPCVKNKDVITDQQGTKHEFTVWNATDLKNFPIKIEINEQGNDITQSFRNVNFSKPDASLFNPPAGCTKYDSMQEMMQAVVMKHMGGMGAPPAGQ